MREFKIAECKAVKFYCTIHSYKISKSLFTLAWFQRSCLKLQCVHMTRQACPVTEILVSTAKTSEQLGWKFFHIEHSSPGNLDKCFFDQIALLSQPRCQNAIIICFVCITTSEVCKLALGKVHLIWQGGHEDIEGGLRKL